MDLSSCLFLAHPYHVSAVIPIEKYLERGTPEDVRERSPIVWRGRHLPIGSSGLVIHTGYHTGVIILLGQLAKLDKLPETRSELLDVKDLGCVSLSGSIGTRAHSLELIDQEKEFLGSGWYVSSLSTEYGSGAVSYCPAKYKLDQIDTRLMRQLGINSAHPDSFDEISF